MLSWMVGTGATSTIRFDHVTVAGDGGERLLDDLELELQLAGTVAVVGPSGAGKTTLLRLCNRLEVPTSGRVLLDGEDLAGLDPLRLRRRVGMVSQRPVLFAGSVRDNLAVAAPHADPAPMLERVGLDRSLLDRQADDLSGGEAQRLCVARTLATEPEILLMDEPTASLDAVSRDRVEELVRALNASGMSILWVTHDLEQAARLASRCVVLIDGRLASPDDAALYLDGENPRPTAGGDRDDDD
jgi:putative ABC transport system ATP-binding protein